MLAAAVHCRAQGAATRAAPGAHGIHDMLGVTLDQRHRGLHAGDELPALLAERKTQDLAMAQTLGERAQVAQVGGRSSAPSETVTCSPAISSCRRPARCSRSQGAPENWIAWVSSWMATQETSCSRSTCMLRAAWARLGATSSRRGVTEDRAARGRTGRAHAGRASPPSLRPGRRAAARRRRRSRRKAARDPGRRPCGDARLRRWRCPSLPLCWARGSRIGRMPLRLAAIHVGRSTASRGGSAAGRASPVVLR